MLKTKSCLNIKIALYFVHSLSEGLASNVTVTIPSLSGKPAVMVADSWVVPTDKNGLDANGDTVIDPYVPADDAPFTKFGVGNVGMIKLPSKLTFDNSKIENKIFMGIIF